MLWAIYTKYFLIRNNLSNPQLLSKLPIHQSDPPSRDYIEHGVTKAVNAIPGNLCEVFSPGQDSDFLS